MAEKLGLPLEGSVNISTALGEARVPRTKAVRIKVCGSVVEMPVIVTEIKNDVLLGLDWSARTGAFIMPASRKLVFPSREIALDSMEETVRVRDEESQEIFLTEVHGMEHLDSNVEEDMASNFTPREIPHAYPNEWVDIESARRINGILRENQESFCESIMGLGSPNVDPIEIDLKVEKPVYKARFRKSRKETEVLKKEIEKILHAKMIRPSKSASLWSPGVCDWKAR